MPTQCNLETSKARVRSQEKWKQWKCAVGTTSSGGGDGGGRLYL